MLRLELSASSGARLFRCTYPGTVLKKVLKNKLYMRENTMKKRIISLILVVAMAFLTLTGCAYNYAKDDMSKYATLKAEDFYTALQNLLISDADFGTNEEERQVKVQDAIAQAILKVTDTTEKKFADKLAQYDALYFAYYATDDMGNIFYASKMSESSLTNVQLGLSTLKDLNLAISKAALALDKDIAEYIYTTSAASVVGDKDVVSVSYTRVDKDGKETKVNNEYFVITTGDNEQFGKNLVGKQVGVTLDEFKVTETVGANKESVEYTYKNVKVESILQDNSTPKVADGDTVNVTYTVSFDATPWYNAETKKYEFGENSGLLATNVDAEGKYKVTYTNVFVNAKADATLPEGATDEEKAAAKTTFEGQIIGKGIGTVSGTITAKNNEIDGKTVNYEYSAVKVNWIVNSEMNSFTVKYTPYAEELKDDNSNKKTETSTIGEKVILNGVELTYHIFPVYYLDVEELSAELIVREFYSVITETKAHDEAEEGETEGDHEHEKLFTVLTKNYKNGDKTLEALVTELSTLYSTLSSKESDLKTKLSSLKTAQENLAKTTKVDSTTSATEIETLVTKKDTAYTAFKTAQEAVDKAQKDVDDKIAEILACKDGETAVAEGLVTDYKNYQYYTLETAYKNEMNKSIVTEIIKYLEKNVKFEDNLPKKAVNEAYDSIMNSYKYNFYEGYYTDSTSSSTSTAKVTNYSKYNGDFNAYLMAVTKTENVKDAKAAVKAAAEETVKDIIIIYVLTDAIEAYGKDKWAGAQISITKEEKKNIKKNIEAQEVAYKSYQSLYEMYGMSYSDVVPSYSDAYNSSQFDKAINYLLERSENVDNKIVYKHIAYSTEAAEK